MGKFERLNQALFFEFRQRTLFGQRRRFAQLRKRLVEVVESLNPADVCGAHRVSERLILLRFNHFSSIKPVLGTGCADSGRVSSSSSSPAITAASGTFLSATSLTRRTLIAASVRKTPPAITT